MDNLQAKTKQPEPQRAIDQFTSEELGLLLNEQYGRIIQLQDNIKIINQLLQQRKEQQCLAKATKQNAKK